VQTAVIPSEYHSENRRLLTRIETLGNQARVTGDETALRCAIDDYLDSHAARAVIIGKINVSSLIPKDPLSVSAAVNVRALPRRARTGACFWIRKDDGSPRLVCSLSLPLRLALGMAKEILIRVHAPRDHIADWRGRGPQYSVRRLSDDLQRGNFVVLADVIDCFASANPEHAYRLGSPISDFVEACIHPRRVRLCGPGRTIPSLVSGTQSRTGLPGLLRAGPAANVLWAMMIDDLPGALPDGVRANTYADNIVIACHSTQEADAVEASLIRYFTNHPAGPFTLRFDRADVDGGFDHLGYNIFRQNGAIHVSPEDNKLDRLTARIEREIHGSDYPATELDLDRITARCCSPWPALSAAARDAIREEVRIVAQCRRVSEHQ
jgi:hypothetical protein